MNASWHGMASIFRALYRPPWSCTNRTHLKNLELVAKDQLSGEKARSQSKLKCGKKLDGCDHAANERDDVNVASSIDAEHDYST